ncbi:hypothetical protein [Rummeliibacillus suwonensis]|uniref:hypothetical protein n=1 Tax=Rummeliibacillus suwonensis TaxID=1306154 RepID=UPI0011B4DBF6|nr:hypothetical protein [Rummeliibacillus suwonensis]
MNKSIYIKSIEASDIYSNNVRCRRIRNFEEYKGALPYSLELEKMLSLKDFDAFTKNKTRTKKEKEQSKLYTNDIINVEFSQKVISGRNLITKLTKKIDEIKEEQSKLVDENGEYIDKQEYKSLTKDIENKNNYIQLIESELKGNKRNPKWKGLNRSKLREKLYTEGFKLTFPKWKKTKDGKSEIESEETIEYVFYKRSSAKSRTGKCLFIKKSLHDTMINWSRLGLNKQMQQANEIDLPALMSYESLISSSIEDTLTIKSENILLIDDVKSVFRDTVNVVKPVTYIDNEGKKITKLDSTTVDDHKIKNDIWDGQSLLKASYFKDGQSMMLLRNHMYKSAAFATNVQQFLKDKHPANIKFEEWQIKDMFGDLIYAKDVHLITTPNSLKALKFADYVGGKKKMYDHWKKFIEKDGCKFGVVKHEKTSKQGTNEQGEVLQQTSYQLLNTLPAKFDNVKQLADFEIKYIEQLKNNDEIFAEHILKTANAVNSNKMMYELYQLNNDFEGTKMFRDFRKDVIRNYIKHVKKGHLRIAKSDNCVLLSNPIEYLYRAIGRYDTENVKSLALHDNQVYCKLFDWNEELVGARHPHTASSNYARFTNTYNKEINTYFELSNNIIVINSVCTPIMDRLSGCDFDSDQIYVSNNKLLLELVDKVYGKCNVVVNGIEPEKSVKYRLTNKDACKIDNKLSESTKIIGEIVNLGQLAQSIYGNLKSKNKDDATLQKILKYTDVVTIASMLAIDMAKRFYKVNLKDEIERIKKELVEYMPVVNDKNEELVAKPLFFKTIEKKSNNNSNNNTKWGNAKYETPMDYLQLVIKKEYADRHKNVEVELLLNDVKFRGYNQKQEEITIQFVNDYVNKVKSINAKYSNLEDDDDKTEEKYRLLADVTEELNEAIGKRKMNNKTVYAIVNHSVEGGKCNSLIKLFNTLYNTKHDAFMSCFTQKSAKK